MNAQLSPTHADMREALRAAREEQQRHRPRLSVQQRDELRKQRLNWSPTTSTAALATDISLVNHRIQVAMPDWLARAQFALHMLLTIAKARLTNAQSEDVERIVDAAFTELRRELNDTVGRHDAVFADRKVKADKSDTRGEQYRIRCYTPHAVQFLECVQLADHACWQVEILWVGGKLNNTEKFYAVKGVCGLLAKFVNTLASYGIHSRQTAAQNLVDEQLARGMKLLSQRRAEAARVSAAEEVDVAVIADEVMQSMAPELNAHDVELEAGVAAGLLEQSDTGVSADVVTLNPGKPRATRSARAAVIAASA